MSSSDKEDGRSNETRLHEGFVLNAVSHRYPSWRSSCSCALVCMQARSLYSVTRSLYTPFAFTHRNNGYGKLKLHNYIHKLWRTTTRVRVYWSCPIKKILSTAASMQRPRSWRPASIRTYGTYQNILQRVIVSTLMDHWVHYDDRQTMILRCCRQIKSCSPPVQLRCKT